MGSASSTMAHQVCAYSSDAEFLATALPFVEGGLSAGEPVLAATTADNIALLRAALGLRADLIDYAETSAFGRRPPERLTGFDRYWRSQAGVRVRILAEPVWAGRSRRERIAWAHMESSLTALFADTRMWMICPYDRRTVPGGVLAEAYRTHPEAITGTAVRPSTRYVPPEVFGSGRVLEDGPSIPAAPMCVSFTAAELLTVRDRALAYTDAAGVPGARARDLTRALDELASNVVMHGAGRGRVWFWSEEDELVCEVSDRSSGRPLDPMEGRPPRLGERGRGLWRVRRLCDRVHIRSQNGRTVVRVHLLVR